MSTPQRQHRWRAIRAVAHRDLLEFIRDRRTLFVTLLMPMAMYPVLALASTLGLRTALLDLEAREAARSLTVVLSGPDAVAFAERLRETFEMTDDSPPPDWPAELAVTTELANGAQRLIDDGKADVWIDLSAGTMARLDGWGTVPIEARISAIRPADARQQQHFVAVMKGVAEDARQRRMASEGMPQSILTPITLGFTGGAEVDEPASMRSILPTAAGGVLVLLALLTATAAFYPAIDAIAGEKERGTIETLLIVPATAGDIVTGKFLAIWGVTLAALVVNAVSIGLTVMVLMRFVPAEFDLGLAAGRAVATAGVTLLAFIGLAAVAAAACLVVTSGARSAKEAQNTLTPVILLASGLAGSALLPGTDSLVFSAVPFAGQVALARGVLAGMESGPAIGHLTISLVASAVASWALLRGAAAALADEELLFRGPDTAGGLFARPAPRRLPTPMQGFAAALAAFATLWYAQGIAPQDLAWGVPIQQTALLVPLAGFLLWQRVVLRATFGLTAPGRGRWPTAVSGGVFTGAGLFVVLAAATITLRGTHLSPAARDLAERIMELLRSRPWWAGWLLLALVPAVCEELFFRGWMLAAFAGERPSQRRALAAMLLQAAVFAAFHLLPERMPQTFLLGIVLGWMTLRTGSLLPAVFAHLAHNSVPLVLVAFADRHGQRLVAGDMSSISVMVVTASALAVVAGLWLVRRSGLPQST